jgi:hypothetical protein
MWLACLANVSGNPFSATSLSSTECSKPGGTGNLKDTWGGSLTTIATTQWLTKLYGERFPAENWLLSAAHWHGLHLAASANGGGVSGDQAQGSPAPGLRAVIGLY